MVNDEIINQRTVLKAVISEAIQKLQDLQQTCPHTEGVFTYEKSFDEWGCTTEYWKRMQCDICGKDWHEDCINEDGTKNPNYLVNPDGYWTHKD